MKICNSVMKASFRKMSTATMARNAVGVDVLSPTIGLTDDQQEFYNLSKSFADVEMKPFAGKWDASATFPMETFKKFGDLGFGGMFVKEDVGGTGLSRLDTTVIIEGLATGCVGTTAMLTIHNMCAGTIPLGLEK